MTRFARRYSAHPWASPLRGQREALFKNAPGVFVGAARLLRARSVQLAAPVVEPRSGVLIPPVENIKEKSPYFRTGSHLEYGGEGGLTRFARPCGAARLLRARSVQLAAPVVEPRSGVLIPPVENIKEKSPYFRTGSHLEYGGEGGFEPPIRCRIHTFQACSFSHSDTSPYCLSRCCRERALM